MTLTPEVEIRRIRAKLGHLEFESPPPAFLNTGRSDLNQVLGHSELGIPYGRIMEISGWESHGKTGIALSLLALAQADGAEAIKADFELCHDPSWDERRGVAVSRLHVFQPYVGRFGSEKSLRLCTAEELWVELEHAIERLHRRGAKKQILLVDSVPAMLPEGTASVAMDDRTMRQNFDLAMLLSSLLQKWVGLAHAYSVLVLFVNQLRHKPRAFGDPAYTPGGNALKFYSHVRIRIRRAKGGLIKRRGQTVGIQGIITNLKNKCGGLEGSRIGYRLLFDGPIEFVDAATLERKDEEE